VTARLVSAPIVALATAGALSLMLGAGGNNPVWRSEPLNLAEAAALRDIGEVARLLSQGADPRAERHVRAGFLYTYPARLTPMDAAVRGDRPEIVQLLLDSGLALDADTWRRAWCTASTDEMRRTLIAAQVPGSSRACDGGPSSAPQAPSFGKE
jgi:hypothetical protein